MKEGRAWSLVATAAALEWRANAPAAAQTSGPGSTLLAPPAALPRPPSVDANRGTKPVITVSPAALPSTVSPMIERLMQQRGASLPPPDPTRRPIPPIGSPSPVRPRPGATLAQSGTRPGTPTPATPVATELPPLPERAEPNAADLAAFSLKPAPIQPTDLAFPITLATDLRLSDACPLMVAAAQAGVWVAEAELVRAKVLWVPMAIFGVDFLRHYGVGPDFNKGIMTGPSVNYFEAGPGAVLFLPLTDAYFQPRAVSDRQERRVASADLTQTLRLDPRAVVAPLEHDHAQVTLVDPTRSLDDLMSIALVNRPELGSKAALVSAAEQALRREKMRPLIPTLLLGGFQTPAMYTQIGLFGLGPNSSLNQFRYRDDVSVQLIWQLEGFGIGNLARIKAKRGEQSDAIIKLRKVQDMIAGDVNRAQARVQSAAARVIQADRALRTAIITFNGHLEGLEQTRRLENVLVLTFRPQEAVYFLEQLNVSFDEYFTTVAEYSRAQFDLYHAIGYPAREIALNNPPGPVQEVDTARPAYLPPVGNGSPPARR